MTHTIYFSLGSNISPKLNYLKAAVRELKKSGIKIVKLSSIYRTAPVGYKNQPYFYNAVGKGETNLKPLECLDLFKSIEKKLGRKPRRRFGPREIDIDLLIYGKIKMRSRRLILPHPRMHSRKFVLDPLKEIDTKKFRRHSLRRTDAQESVVVLNEYWSDLFE